jgi:hypothetical protein
VAAESLVSGRRVKGAKRSRATPKAPLTRWPRLGHWYAEEEGPTGSAGSAAYDPADHRIVRVTPGAPPGSAHQGRSPVRARPGAASAAEPPCLLVRGTRQVTVYLCRRRACLRIASTFAANAVGSMIGVPRHGDIDSRSVSLETMSSAPTSAAKSRIRLSSWSGQS